MRKKGEKRDSKPDNQEDAAFDVLTRELVFEAKARPGERTLTGAAAGGCSRLLAEKGGGGFGCPCSAPQTAAMVVVVVVGGGGTGVCMRCC
jgi:hypothetical protein